RWIHVFQTLLVEPGHFKSFPCERLHYTHRSQHFLHDRNQFTLLLPNRARSLLDASSERVNHYEKRRGNRKGDQCKSPIDVQHDSDHAEQSQQIDEHAEKRGVDKILDGTDIASDASDQVSRL